MKFFVVLLLLSVTMAASPGRHEVVRRQAPTQIPPANPEVATVFKVSCNCPFVSSYNPVCGSDGQTYGNKQILQCARSCGSNVTLLFEYACGSNRG